MPAQWLPAIWTSPQRYGTFWLWNIRITGTGAAYRDAHNEFCWRPAEIYLNDEFLARCNGLPVIFVHPETKGKLDSEEFHNRIVGTVFVPFLRGEEVWAVCRIYDADTIEILSKPDSFSTSPGVVFGPDSGNQTLKLKDGTNLLIEGKPALLDHIALVPAGVWDRGGPPTGIETTRVDSTLTTTESLGMTEEEKAAAEQARKDNATKLDAIMDAVGGLKARMDSMEAMDSARKDAEEKERKDRARFDACRMDKFAKRKDGESYKDWGKRHDADEAAMCDAMRKDGAEDEKAREDAKRARKDAEDEERRADESFDKWAKEEEGEGEHKKDAAETEEEKRALEKANEEKAREDARKDDAMTENAELHRKLAELSAVVKSFTTEVTAEDRNALASAQSRADGIAGLFGSRALPPMPGEAPAAYRRRLAGNFKRHSEKFKDSRFDGMDDATFAAIEEIVYADAASAARSPSRGATGVLIPIREPDETGRMLTRWTGDSLAWRQHFMTGAQVGRIKNQSELRA